MEQKRVSLELLRYVKDELHYFETIEDVEIEEIGDGNLNYVFRFTSLATAKSLIIKKAETCARFSDEFKIPLRRTGIESFYIHSLNHLIGGYLPTLYGTDVLNGILAMEDLSNYKILRSELMKFHTFPFLTEALADALSKALMGTTSYCMEQVKREQMMGTIKDNPLNEIITKTLVFEEPYNNCYHRNNVLAMNQDYVQNELYHDEALWKICTEYKEKFFSEKQALLHGDLHTGSIFIKEDTFKFIDFEFSFWGPIGFDLGCLLANFIFAFERACHDSSKESKVFQAWMKEVILYVYPQFTKKSRKILCDANVNIEEIERFLNEIIHDTIVYAGIELIRRTVGMANVKDITTIEPITERMKAERRIIQVAKKLMLEAKNWDDLKDIMNF